MSSFSDVFLQYICPALGCVMASLMFAAPVRDLRACLIKGSLGSLNPFPWTMMTGNCLGWTVYAYYTRDPFVLAANVPGLLLSIWLNTGASKLQYLEQQIRTRTIPHLLQRNNERQWDADAMESESFNDEQDLEGRSVRWNNAAPDTNEDDDEASRLLVMVPQERALMRVLIFWVLVIVYVGWFAQQWTIPLSSPSQIVGVVVNINLVFYYGAPLRTIQIVIATRNSSSIHVPTMCMNLLNTTFWIAYGLARMDPIIVIPNAIGLLLGVMQGILCAWYPRVPPLSSHLRQLSSSSSPTPNDDVIEDNGHVLVPQDDRFAID